MSKHLESLKSSIAADETVVAWCNGSIEGESWGGILALTSKRFVFHRKGVFGDTTKAVHLDKVSAVEFEQSFLIKGRVKVHTSGTGLTFMAHSKERFSDLKTAWEAAR